MVAPPVTKTDSSPEGKKVPILRNQNGKGSAPLSLHRRSRSFSSACDRRRTRGPKKCRCSAARTEPRLLRSSPHPLVCHSWQGGLHEVAANCVEDEGQHDRTPLVGIWEAKCPLFQDGFVGLGKWFLGRTQYQAACWIRTS